MNFKRLVFIVGFPRSGTTMLRSILADTSDLVVHEIEPHWILDIWKLYQKKEIEKTFFIPFLIEHPKFPAQDRWPNYINLTSTQLKDVFKARDKYNLKEVVEKIFAFCYQEELKVGRQELLLKYPRLTFVPDLLHWLSPNAGIVHIYRDPRAAIASYLSRWNNKSISELSSYWNTSVAQGFSFEDRNFNTVNVKYEDLLLNTQFVLQRVCETVRIEVTKDVGHFSRPVRSWSRGKKGVQSFEKEGINIEKANKWQSILKQYEIAMIEEDCNDWMQQLGYESLANNRIKSSLVYQVQKIFDRYFLGSIRRWTYRFEQWYS